MARCKTGDKKIRSAVREGALVADKTGSGGHNTSNDIAVIWPVGKPPLVLTIYLTGAHADSADQQSALIAWAATIALRQRL